MMAVSLADKYEMGIVIPGTCMGSLCDKPEGQYLSAKEGKTLRFQIGDSEKKVNNCSTLGIL